MSTQKLVHKYSQQHSSNIPKWKQPKYLWTDELISKMCYIHTVEYCSVIRRSEVVVHAKTRMNLEILMLGKRHQTQKPHGRFHSYKISRISIGDSVILSKYQVKNSKSNMLFHRKNLAQPVFQRSGVNLLWQKFGLQPYVYSIIQLYRMTLNQYEKQMRFLIPVRQNTR